MNKQFVKKIEVLLENSLVDPSISYKRTKMLLSAPVEEKEVESPEDFEFINEHVIYLRKLYFQLSLDDQKIFRSCLLRHIRLPDEFAAISFSTLVHTGNFDLGFKIFISNFDDAVPVYLSVAIVLSRILRYEWNSFTSKQLADLENWITKTINSDNKLGNNIMSYRNTNKDYISIFSTIFRQTNMIIAKSIREEIDRGFNPEVKEDERKLKEEFKRYDFPKDLSETLDKIDQKFNSASDSFDFKGCMDLIRSFTERLYKSIAISLDSKKGKDLNEKEAKDVASFFQKEGLISEEQGLILIALRHFLSNLASHRLKSSPEDARLSRNMTIEFSTYLFKRYKELSKTSN